LLYRSRYFVCYAIPENEVFNSRKRITGIYQTESEKIRSIIIPGVRRQALLMKNPFIRTLLRVTVILLITVLIIAMFRLYRKYYAYPKAGDDYFLYRDTGQPGREGSIATFTYLPGIIIF